MDAILQEYDWGITLVDCELYKTGMAACYLIESQGRLGIIETGTGHTVAVILKALAQKGYSPEQVDYIMPTHVHLDHAGGVGGLMQACPNAQLVIHPQGAAHMINPEKLIAGSVAVYGQAAFHKQFGDIVPVPEARVLMATDKFSVILGQRTLVFRDAPGHARHHYAIWDADSSGVFTGDVFGLSYRYYDTETDVQVMPTTTPIQFDPDAWDSTLAMLMAYKPERMFLTHYGMIEQPQPFALRLREYLNDYVAIAMKYAAEQNRHICIKQALTEHTHKEIHRLGHSLSISDVAKQMAVDIELSAQGLNVWLTRMEKKHAQSAMQ